MILIIMNVKKTLLAGLLFTCSLCGEKGDINQGPKHEGKPTASSECHFSRLIGVVCGLAIWKMSKEYRKLNGYKCPWEK